MESVHPYCRIYLNIEFYFLLFISLPNEDDLNGKWNSAVSFDVLLMLSGRRGERSRLEWSNLANEAGFVLEDVLPTASVTVDMAILSLA